MGGFFTVTASRCKRSFIPALFAVLTAAPAVATTWQVGSGRALTGPAQAAAVVKAGDRVVLDPGIYRDCAIWTKSHLTIEARPAPSSMLPSVMTRAIVTGTVCGDRALFFFTGNDITVRGIVFRHARGSEHNGAGILMEGANLTVQDSRFEDNENGILAGGPQWSVVRVENSAFEGNGSCDEACAHALYAGARIARLEVSHCLFRDTHVAHNIKSRARSTIVRDSRIEDGDTGSSSYLIELPDGGDAGIVNNVLQKGVHSDNREAAISIGAPGEPRQSDVLDIRGNRFVNDLPSPVFFVRNATQAPARLRNNTLVGRVVPLQGPGTVE